MSPGQGSRSHRRSGLRSFFNGLISDLPWSAERCRSTIFLTLPFFGLIGGALQGKLVYLSMDEECRGDYFIWHLVEFFAWIGGALGLAVGAALAMTRHLA